MRCRIALVATLFVAVLPGPVLGEEGMYPITEIGRLNWCAWNQAYSRSIAVDIRYVLWVTEQVGRAPFLLAEMGVK